MSAPAKDPNSNPANLEEQWVDKLLGGTYRIRKVLDYGGMGMVFAAEHARLKRPVAVKVLASHLAHDEQALSRFQREAEILSQVSHPNVVHVLDFHATEAGEPYLVMELLQGESLEARLTREGSLSITDTATITSQVASGLAAAHRAGIVHRDLKPANIFLVEMPDESSFGKLLDFGISKRLGASRGLTGEFDVLGTPEYMTPEQALGKTALVDHRGDQYSLAVIAFEMLAARPPFVGEDVMSVLRQVVSSPAPNISLMAPHVPAAVDVPLQRALAKEPEERFDSIREFAREFGEACGHASLGPPASLSPTIPSMAATRQQRPTADIQVTERIQAPNSTSSDSRVRPRGVSSPGAAKASPLSEITSIIAEARTALASGDVELAADLAEAALTLSDRAEAESVRSAVTEAATLFNRIFMSQLGSMDRRPVVRQVPSTRDGTVTSEQAFLLSRVDGTTSIDEVLDLSPLPRQQTLRHLVSLMRSGVIDVL